MLVLSLEPVKGQRDCESNVPTPHWKKLAVSLASAVGGGCGFEPRRLRKDHICTSATVRKVALLLAVWSQWGWFTLVLVQRQCSDGLCVPTLLPSSQKVVETLLKVELAYFSFPTATWDFVINCILRDHTGGLITIILFARTFNREQIS